MKAKWPIIVLILLVAVFFRFYQIGVAPPGLYPDEAINGNDAAQALEEGRLSVFYPDNNGREGLFINLQAISLKVFGHQPWALRMVSAVIGTLTVLGIYLLTRELFNWQIASIASYLTAIGFWHVLFSRIGFRAIMAPMLLVWGLYFFWKGLRSGRLLPFALSGVFWGAGFYTYISFRVMPLALVLTLLAYWRAVKKDFPMEQYAHIRRQMLRGFVMFMLVAILVALPIGLYYWLNQADFLGRTSQLSVFASDNPLEAIITNTVKTAGMFNFIGDHNWRHNVAGQPILLWPVGVLFVIGFFRSWKKLLKPVKTHGHMSTSQTLLLWWFFIGLIPVVVSNEGIPHSLRAIMVAPVVFIFAAEGLWWVYELIKDWYHARDVHEVRLTKRMSESAFIAALTVIIFLATITVAEYDKYFNKWAKDPRTAAAFNQNYVDLGRQLNTMSVNVKKYILVNAEGIPVNGIPMPAQTVMFITDTATPEKQRAKNIYYLTPDQHRRGQYDKRGIVIPLEK